MMHVSLTILLIGGIERVKSKLQKAWNLNFRQKHDSTATDLYEIGVIGQELLLRVLLMLTLQLLEIKLTMTIENHEGKIIAQPLTSSSLPSRI
jgi:hypothetical protein